MRSAVLVPDGKIAMVSDAVQDMQYPYYFKDGSLDGYKGYYQLGRFVQSAPASKAGESILAHFPSATGKDIGLWQYLVGQRRVSRAPAVSYDTPDSVTSGLGFFDEAFMLFPPYDHHDYKLVGKKEIFVPYNNNRANAAAPDDLFKPQFLNPDLVRWELHRVWQIEATVAPGKRHVVAKRMFYLDEDSWQILLTDGWDAQGKLWRMSYTLTELAPDGPALTSKRSTVRPSTDAASVACSTVRASNSACCASRRRTAAMAPGVATSASLRGSRKLRANPRETSTTSPFRPVLSTSARRMTCMLA